MLAIIMRIRFFGTPRNFFRPGGFDFVLRLNGWGECHSSPYAKTVSIVSPILSLFSVRVGSEPRGWTHARRIIVSRSRKRAEQYKPEQRHFLPGELWAPVDRRQDSGLWRA